MEATTVYERVLSQFVPSVLKSAYIVPALSDLTASVTDENPLTLLAVPVNVPPDNSASALELFDSTMPLSPTA
jgi:hypothetical protein